MTLADLISLLQTQDPTAIAVLSMFPGPTNGPLDVVAVQRADVCAVQLHPVDDDEYRKRYAVVVDGGVPGVWLG